MSSRPDLSRRTFLRGLGTAMALPLLEGMSPVTALAGAAGAPASAGGRALAAPRRMAFIYIPNGAIMERWTPSTEGAGFELPYVLEPLAPLRDDLLVLSGLTHDKARHNGDGGGDHARSASSYLTGVQAVKTLGEGIRLGPSVDQIAASVVGRATRIPSLELGCDPGSVSGNCDSGYSCAYTSNISWRSETTPMAKEVDPRAVFERLFRSENRQETDESLARRRRYRKSILDFVLDDARRLSRRVGRKDRQKLDEYFSGIREIERRIELIERRGEAPPPPEGVEAPAGVPQEYEEHLRLLSDMVVLAFQGDVTRVSTFMFANAGSNRSYRHIGISDGHHELSHHGGDLKKQAKLAEINRFHVEHFAYLLERLRSIDEGDGTLLDNCMIVYGSGISDGNRHNHDNLPVVLAGRGGGTITSGRHLRYPGETPLTNLYLSLLERMHVPRDELGDSTGRLPNLGEDLPLYF